MFGSVDPNCLAPTRVGPSTIARRGVLIPDLGERLRLGCVYELQPLATFGVLVTCSRPRSRGVASNAVRARFSTWWPMLAPSLRLVEARRPDGTSLGWEEFAARYWAELGAKPISTHMGTILQIGEWLRRHPTVTLLSIERARPGEEQGRTQRRILRAWLLGAVHWQEAA